MKLPSVIQIRSVTTPPLTSDLPGSCLVWCVWETIREIIHDSHLSRFVFRQVYFQFTFSKGGLLNSWVTVIAFSFDLEKKKKSTRDICIFPLHDGADGISEQSIVASGCSDVWEQAVMVNLCRLCRPLVKTYWQTKTFFCFYHRVRWAPQTVTQPSSKPAVSFTKLVFTAWLSFTHRLHPRPEHKAVYHRVGNTKLRSPSNGKK